eukprot:CAMPEP_0115247330 /NCGR_PEP_ID=MMETSP0270-20121206/41492_1 /TAXON_ID=71861 /ORGANISM="Scrippsiella trochoidea, Strain CCMP3099" /LENGTH=106 /DNA_ID=CAMNT_0002662583 /DNA_START=1362 /DNA_END=1682 /DNA_ORIENTATION=+
MSDNAGDVFLARSCLNMPPLSDDSRPPRPALRVILGSRRCCIGGNCWTHASEVETIPRALRVLRSQATAAPTTALDDVVAVALATIYRSPGCGIAKALAERRHILL